MLRVIFNLKTRVLVCSFLFFIVSFSNSLVHAEWKILFPPEIGPGWYLNSLHFTSPNEGWAVGGKVLLQYFNGIWVPSTIYIYSNAGLNSVHLISSNEGWAVGWDNSNGEEGLLYHYFNDTWTKVDPPNVIDETASCKEYCSWELNGVHFTSSNEGWAAGGNEVGHAVLLHYLNGTLTSVSAPSQDGSYLRSVHFTSPNEGWAVGGHYGKGVLLYYLNGSWTSVTTPDVSSDWGLNSVYFVSPDEGWAVGSSFVNSKFMPNEQVVILHYLNGSWTVVNPPKMGDFPNNPNACLNGVHFTSPNEGWAVGWENRGNSQFTIEPQGLLLHYLNGSWSYVNPPVVIVDYKTSEWELYGVHFTSPNEGWAVGRNCSTNRGLLLSHSSTPVEIVSAPTYLSGPTSGYTGVSHKFSTNGSSSNFGHPVEYRFDWGDGTFSSWQGGDYASASKSWTSPGVYAVKSQAHCQIHPSVASDWSAPISVTISVFDEIISTPSSLNGAFSGEPGKSYSYSIGGASSNSGHSIQYLFDWGDGTNSGWLPVGTTSAAKSWASAGIYKVKAQARCAVHTNIVSNWSNYFSVYINWTPLVYTVTTNPVGLQVIVDGSIYASPHTFSWPIDSVHALSVSFVQSGSAGTRYIFSSWSDGGSQSHTIKATSSSVTYTANFSAQYLLTTSVNPLGAGIVNPFGENWYNDGEIVSISVIINSGYFSGWTGDISGTTNPISITMNRSKSIIGNFNTTSETISPPSTPNGPSNIVTGQTCNYSKGGSSSNLGHPVEYRFDWGDGTYSNWSSSLSAAKSWSSSGNYSVRVQGRCATDTFVLSLWSSILPVSVKNAGPDLTGEWTTPLTQTCRNTRNGQKCTVNGVLTISNIGNCDASSSYVAFYFSDDGTYDEAGTPLKSVATGKVKAGKNKAITLSKSFALGQTVIGKYIIAVIDKYDSVAEVDETNNIIVFGPID